MGHLKLLGSEKSVHCLKPKVDKATGLDVGQFTPDFTLHWTRYIVVLSEFLETATEKPGSIYADIRFVIWCRVSMESSSVYKLA